MMIEVREAECSSIVDRPLTYTCVCVGQSDVQANSIHADNFSRNRSRNFLRWLPFLSSRRCRHKGFHQSAVIYLWTILILLQATGVLSQLRYTRIPSNTRITQQQDAVLTCAGSNSTVILIWQKDGQNLFIASSKQPGVGDSYSLVNTSDLKVTSATSANSGIYVCTVSTLNPVSAILTVLVPPDAPVINPDTTNIQLTEGEQLTLTCSSSRGNPPPDIQWNRNDVSIAGGQTSTDGGTTSSQLAIPLTWEDDQATYACKVWNEVNSNTPLSTNKLLRVRYAPRITFRPFDPSYVVVLGQEVSINCEVKAFPETTAYTWEKDNVRLGSVSNELRFPSVEKTDSGVYSCSAFNGVGQATTKALTLIVQYGPEIVNFSEILTVNENDRINITCETEALPPISSFTWKSTSGIVSNKSKLGIAVATRRDADNYTCTVKNELRPSGKASITKPASRTVQVLVKYAPGPAKVVSPGSHSIGDRVEFQCQLPEPGYPDGQVEWQKDENQVVQRPIYVIQQASLSDSGKYKCRGKNSFGEGEWGSLNILINEPPRIISPAVPARNISVDVVNFQLSCEARGLPEPNIEWLKNGERVSTSYFEILEEPASTVDVYSKKVRSSLRFKGSGRGEGGGRVDQILISDTANYTCAVAANVSQTTQLFVQYPPVVTVDPKKTAENSTVIFRCVAKANPEPLFKWEFNGVELISANKYRILSGGLGDKELEFVSSLIISNITSSELGTYTCKATNALGENSAVGQVVVKSKPDPSTNLEALEYSWTSILLQWEPGFNGGEQQTFLITYVSDDGPENIEAPNSSYNITGLLPSVTYTLSVAGKNSLGEGDYSDSISVTTLPYNITYPTEVKFNPTTGILSFRAPDDTSYSALIRVMTKGSSEWQTNTEKNADIQAGSVKLPQKDITRVDISFCVQENICSQPSEAKFDAVSAGASGSDLPTEGVIAIACLCAVIIIILFIVLFCVIRRKRKEKAARDFELETQPNRRSQPIAPKIKDNTPKQGYDNPDFSANSVHPSRQMNGHIPARNNDLPYIYEDKNNTSFESRDVKKYDDFITESYGDQPLTFHPYSTNYYQPDDNYYRERRMSGQKEPSMSGQESGYSTPEPSKPKKLPKFLQRKRGLVYYADSAAFAHNPPGHTCGLPCCHEGDDLQMLSQSTQPRCVGIQTSCHTSNFSLGRADRNLLLGRPTFKNGNFSLRPIVKVKRSEIPDFDASSSHTIASGLNSSPNSTKPGANNFATHISNFTVGESADNFVDSDGLLPYYQSLPSRSGNAVQWNRPAIGGHRKDKTQSEDGTEEELVLYGRVKGIQHVYAAMPVPPADKSANIPVEGVKKVPPSYEVTMMRQSQKAAEEQRNISRAGVSGDDLERYTSFPKSMPIKTIQGTNFAAAFPSDDNSDTCSETSSDLEQDLEIFTKRLSIVSTLDVDSVEERDHLSMISSVSEDSNQELYNPITLIL